MANHADETGKPPADHQATYEGFLTAAKWGVIIASLVLIFMAIVFVH